MGNSDRRATADLAAPANRASPERDAKAARARSQILSGGDDQLDKQKVVDLLGKEGKNDHVQKALQELPEKIDHEQHAQMLQQKFGLGPASRPRKHWEKELH